MTERVRLCTGIAQVGARTPAMLAMSALTMQSLSDGRFVLGLGTSGPQVIEGFHGIPFHKPIQRTRETIEIVKLLTSGERSSYEGELYRLPLPGGEGRAIRSSAQPAHVPIHIASLGPRNLELTGELADGWVGTSFIPEHAEVFLDPIRTGAERAGRTLDDVEIVVAAGVEFCDDAQEAAARHARGYAFTFGAMGSPHRNFYKDAFTRQGYGEVASEVQRLWLYGRRDEAAAAVPVELGAKTNLLGTPDEVAARLRVYRDAGVDTIRAGPHGRTAEERLETLARLMDVAAAVNAER